MFETERSMRSPLGRVRGLGSAKHGTEHFWQQRVTSVALVFLSFFLVALVIGLVGRSHATVVMVIGHPVIATLLALTIVVSAVHMKLGMQVIIEDYVHSEQLKRLALMANICFGLLIGAALVYSALRLSFT